MPETNHKKDWDNYCEKEFSSAVPLLENLGYILENEQPHIKGERYLMNALTSKSGKKLILLGKRKKDNQRVVIKITSDKGGAEELRHERDCRETLQKINFAYEVFHSPKELLFSEISGYTISIQEFIDQEKPFLKRPLKEQFSLALKAFKAQESAHATTYENRKKIAENFGLIDSIGYLETFDEFRENLINTNKGNLELLLLIEKARKIIRDNLETIEQYCGFLTHIDFVPHNIRVKNNTIYLLDYSSLRFGNKYEDWARFLNFMVLYNKPLEEALLKYIADNRTEEESLSLKMMRIYRLSEIIWYYTKTLSKSAGNLLILNQKRVDFWTKVLQSIINDKPLDEKIIEEYKQSRDSLRDEEEKLRQIGLH